MDIYSLLSLEGFYHLLIIISLLGFLFTLGLSIILNRNEVKFYRMVTREDGQISKVSIAFVFVLILIVYQIVLEKQVNSYLTELLAIIFAAEVGTKYVDKIKPIKNLTEKKNDCKLSDDE